MKTMVIKTAIRLPNDMVMVFDEEGEQVPEYQGWYEEMKEQLLRDAPLGAEFVHWFYDTVDELVPREIW